MKFLRAIVIVVFVATLPSVATAHTYSPAHYNANCSTGSPDNAKQGQYYALVQNGPYKAIQATAYIASLIPCANATATYAGWGLANVLNAWSTGAFVQFGYAKQACFTNCEDGFVNLRQDFWFTKDDSSGGTIYDAEWIDALDGDTSDHDFPYLGDKYQFTISETSVSGVPKWRYCIKVISSGLYPVGNSDCHNENRSSANGFTWAYWSAEVYNSASGVGNAGNAPTSLLYTPMQYMLSSETTYRTIDGTDTSCQWDSQTGLTAVPAGYNCFESSSGTSWFSAWTASHT